MKKHDLGDLLAVYPTALAYCQMGKVLRPWVNRKGAPFLGVLVVPAEYKIQDYRRAAEVLLLGDPENGMRRYDDRILTRVVSKGNSDFEDLLSDIHHYKPVLYLFENEDDVPEEIAISADVYSVLGRPDIAACQAAVFLICGSRISEADAEYLLGEHWRRTAPVLRKGRSAARSLKILRSNPPRVRKLQKQRPPTGAVDEKPRRLEDLAGYGEAARWGLQLAKDLGDYRAGLLSWEDVDRGLLLSGPPGVGKTRFAQALAATCDVPIVQGSVAEWQSTGYLNDLLKAMRGCFENALASAPCILLIDEIDAFGSRVNEDPHNRTYHRQVIASLLECLDGAVRRVGVVVIGTANYPDHLDPALLRPGRLDHHLRLEFPDPEARLVILEQYLGAGLSGAAAESFLAATVDWSGADIERLARESRRRARLAGRAVTAEDVVASLPEVVPIDVDRLASTAVHEAGHAVYGLAVGRVIEEISLADKYIRRSGNISLGKVTFDLPDFPRRTGAWYLEEIGISLAGMVAEEEVTGQFDDGVGGLETSDLATATRLATLVEGVFGMGSSLVSERCEDNADVNRLRFRNPWLANRVDALLANQMSRVKEVIIDNLPLVEALGREIANRKRMSGEELSEFLRANDLRILKPRKPVCVIPSWTGRTAT
mgnify:CR=1 FL=1